MFTVGQTVWHVGKNVPEKEVTIRWVSRPEAISSESMVLVELLHEAHLYNRYRLIPSSKLSEVRPLRECRAMFNISLTQEIKCDLKLHHIESFPSHLPSRHHAYIGSEGAEVFWG